MKILIAFLAFAGAVAAQSLGGSIQQPSNGTGGAVSSVTGAGTVTCTPTTGAVVCTGAGGGVGSFPTSIFSVSGSTASYATGQTANYIIGSNGSGTIGLYSPATVLGYTPVQGPGSSTNTDLATFNGTTGALLSDSGVALANVVTLAGTQTLTNKTLTSPTLTTPALGTPASGVGTNLTGLTLAGHVAQAANTIVMNATASSASPTAVVMPTCTTGADLYNTSTNTWSCVSTGGGGVTFSPPYLVSGGNYYLQPDFGFQATLPPAFTTGYSTLSGTMTPSAGGGNGDINLTSLYSAAFLQQTALVSSSIETVFSFGNPTLFTESNTYFGPYVCDSTNNKIYALYANVQGNYPVGAFLVSYSVTSCSVANTPSSATTVGSSFYVAPLPHLKLVWSGGTLTAYQSLNGGAGTPKIIGTASVGTIAASGVMGYGVTTDVMSFKVQ